MQTDVTWQIALDLKAIIIISYHQSDIKDFLSKQSMIYLSHVQP